MLTQVSVKNDGCVVVVAVVIDVVVVVVINITHSLTTADAFFQQSSIHFQLTQCRIHLFQALKYRAIHRRRDSVRILTNKPIQNKK